MNLNVDDACLYIIVSSCGSACTALHAIVKKFKCPVFVDHNTPFLFVRKLAFAVKHFLSFSREVKM